MTYEFEWIDIKSALPEIIAGTFRSERVLIVHSDGFIKIGRLWIQHKDKPNTVWVDDSGFVSPHITHWAKLPAIESN